MALNFAVLNRAIVEKRVQLNGLIGRCTVFILAREWYEHVLIGVVVFQARVCKFNYMTKANRFLQFSARSGKQKITYVKLAD